MKTSIFRSGLSAALAAAAFSIGAAAPGPERLPDRISPPIGSRGPAPKPRGGNRKIQRDAKKRRNKSR